MSGAFNIDIECDKGSENKSIVIHCASLTDTWNVTRTGNNLQKFLGALKRDEAIQKNKVALPNNLNPDDIDGCAQFLSRLACTAAVLRTTVLHQFLSVPQSVRDGLTYASHKPFGKVVREGYLQRHPRFVSKGGGKRWIKLTRDDRGGSLICYRDENTKNGPVLASLKIGASTELQNLKDKGVPNAFVLKSGKRQWVLQANTPRDYQTWQSVLVGILKQFGPVNIDTNTDAQISNNQQQKPSSSPRAGNNNNINSSSSKRGGNAGKILKENQELTEKIKKMKAKIGALGSEIDRYKDLEIEIKTNESELKRKGQKQFLKEKEELIAEYEVKQDNLRQEIEELHQKLEQKTADEGGRSGLKSLFGDDFEVVNINDYKDRADAAMGGGGYGDTKDNDMYDDEEEVAGRATTGNYDEDVLENNQLLSGDDSAHIKFLHKHLHRHDHKHIHYHRHTHIHDQTGDTPITYTHTHTIAHTITHTMTQFKIKKNLF